jgi:hypothetical protein
MALPDRPAALLDSPTALLDPPTALLAKAQTTSSFGS